MRRDAVAELIKILLEIVGEESIIIRGECGENGNTGLIILIGIDKIPDN